MLCSAVLFCYIKLCYIVLYYIILWYTTLGTILYCFIPCHTIATMYCAMLYYIGFTIMYDITLHILEPIYYIVVYHIIHAGMNFSTYPRMLSIGYLDETRLVPCSFGSKWNVPEARLKFFDFFGKYEHFHQKWQYSHMKKFKYTRDVHWRKIWAAQGVWDV